MRIACRRRQALPSRSREPFRYRFDVPFRTEIKGKYVRIAATLELNDRFTGTQLSVGEVNRSVTKVYTK